MCMRQSLDFPNRIQSPLNYTGGKFRLLPQILPLFPANIDVLVDLFCGGGNVGINTSAERIVLNDSDKNVIRIFRLFRQYPTEQILEIIDGIIDRYGLSDSRTNGYAFYQCESARGLGTYNKEGYNRLRSELNNMKRRNDRYFFMLFTLIVFAFNNQIRFNEKREFNLPVGKRDFNNNMRNKVRHFAEAIKNPHIELSSNDFRRIPFDGLSEHSLIYADPPWQYQRSKVQGAAENHYPTMSIDELCALPVAQLAAPDSALFLWATFPQLPEALRLIEAWGFTYKSVAFVWLKLNRKSPTWFYGLGYWTRGNAEICLLAKRGHPKRYSKSVHQFIISPVEEHSKKPDITREKIIELAGDLPRAELFARQKIPGWDAWGNEVDSVFSLSVPETR